MLSEKYPLLRSENGVLKQKDFKVYLWTQTLKGGKRSSFKIIDILKNPDEYENITVKNGCVYSHEKLVEPYVHLIQADGKNKNLYFKKFMEEFPKARINNYELRYEEDKPEEWKDIAHHPGFSISNKGNVLYNGESVPLYKRTSDKALFCSMNKGGTKTYFMVWKEVYRNFVDDRFVKYIDYIDGNNGNCSAENLRIKLDIEPTYTNQEGTFQVIFENTLEDLIKNNATEERKIITYDGPKIAIHKEVLEMLVNYNMDMKKKYYDLLEQQNKNKFDTYERN